MPPTPFVHIAERRAGAPILLFLHGIAEGFKNKNEVTSEQHLFNQGPPKLFKKGGAPEILRNELTLVAPQLPDRGTSWESAVALVNTELDKIDPTRSRPLYVAGFSKGGLGALQLVPKLERTPRAIVIVDASPMNEDPQVRAAACLPALQNIPVWAIHTNYDKDNPAHNAQCSYQQFNETLITAQHQDLGVLPDTGTRIRTLLTLTDPDPIKRHTQVSDIAFAAAGVYEWLLRH